jgi:hypothetical protein
MRQGTNGFINVFQVYPDMFRQVDAIFRGSEVPYSSNVCMVGVYGLRSVQCGQLWNSRNGGLEVSMLAPGTQVRGFKPGRSRWIFRAKKTPQALQ